MIVMHESAVTDKADKPILCPKCERGRLGNISNRSQAVLSKRGKPPPNERSEYLQVKCLSEKKYLTPGITGKARVYVSREDHHSVIVLITGARPQSTAS